MHNQPLQDTRKKINNGGTSFHKTIWRRIMLTLHTKLPKAEFEKPPAIISKKICRKSGLLATNGCEHDLRGDASYYESFIDGTQPRTRCNIHTEYGTINMPKRFEGLVTDDSIYVLPSTAVVPIVPNVPTTSVDNNGTSPIIINTNN